MRQNSATSFYVEVSHRVPKETVNTTVDGLYVESLYVKLQVWLNVALLRLLLGMRVTDVHLAGANHRFYTVCIQI